MKIKRGSTSVRRLIFIADSSSTAGAGLANVAFNTAGLVWHYFAGDLSNEVAITPVTATLGTYTSGGFVAVDNTNMPGWYEIGIPDAALDGGTQVAMQLRGVANMVPVNLFIELDAVDYQQADFGLSFRLSNDLANGAEDWAAANTEIATYVWTTAARTITGGTITTNNDKTGYSLSTAPPTAAAIADAVWDEPRSGHTTAGTFGLYLDAQISTISGGGASASDVADAVWNRATTAITTAGSIGLQLKTNADATISSRLASAGYTAPPTATDVSAQIAIDVAGSLNGWASASAELATVISSGISDDIYNQNHTWLDAVNAVADRTRELVWVSTITGYGTVVGTFGKLIVDNLDAAVSTRQANNLTTSNIAAAVWANGTRTITGGTITTNSDKTGYELTTTDKNAIASIVEAEILNDATGGAAVATIANAVAAYFDNAASDIPPQIIADAVRIELAAELARLDVAVSTRLASASYSAPATAAAIADAVWDEPRAGHTTAGTFGLYVDAQISTRATLAAADVWAVGTRTITGGTITTNNDKTGYTLSQAFPTNFASLSVDGSGRVLLQPTQTGVTIPTVTAVTNGVTVATNNDKVGYSLAVSPPTSSDVATAVWSVLTSAITATGSIGRQIKDNLDAAISTRSVYAGSDTAGTTTLLTRVTGLLSTKAEDTVSTAALQSAIASVDTAVDGITASLSSGVDVNVTEIGGSTAVLDLFKKQYDGTGVVWVSAQQEMLVRYEAP